MENPTPLVDFHARSVGLKRNSISMPTLNEIDLERLQTLYKNAEGSSPYSSSDEISDSKTSDSKVVSIGKCFEFELSLRLWITRQG